MCAHTPTYLSSCWPFPPDTPWTTYSQPPKPPAYTNTRAWVPVPTSRQLKRQDMRIGEGEKNRGEWGVCEHIHACAIRYSIFLQFVVFFNVSKNWTRSEQLQITAAKVQEWNPSDNEFSQVCCQVRCPPAGEFARKTLCWKCHHRPPVPNFSSSAIHHNRDCLETEAAGSGGVGRGRGLAVKP